MLDFPNLDNFLACFAVLFYLLDCGKLFLLFSFMFFYRMNSGCNF